MHLLIMKKSAIRDNVYYSEVEAPQKQNEDTIYTVCSESIKQIDLDSTDRIKIIHAGVRKKKRRQQVVSLFERSRANLVNFLCTEDYINWTDNSIGISLKEIEDIYPRDSKIRNIFLSLRDNMERMKRISLHNNAEYMKVLSLIEESCINSKEEQDFVPQSLNVNVNHNVNVPILDRIGSFFVRDIQPLDEPRRINMMQEIRSPDNHYVTSFEPTDSNNLYEVMMRWAENPCLILGITAVLTAFMVRHPKHRVFRILYCSWVMVIFTKHILSSRVNSYRIPVNDGVISLWNYAHSQFRGEFDEGIDLEMEDAQGGEEFEPQSFSDNVSLFTEFLVILLSGVIGMKARAPLADFVKNFFSFNENRKGNMAATLLVISSKVSEFFENIIKIDFLKEYFYVDFITNEEIRAQLEITTSYIASSSAGLAVGDGFGEIVFQTVYDDTLKCLNKVDKNSYEFKSLTNVMKELEKLRLNVKASGYSLNGERIEPVGVLLRGAPGTMKSVLTSRLSSVICQLTVPSIWKDEAKANPNSFTYVMPSDKFFDGYTYKAWVAVVDDLFQRREVAGDTDPQSLMIIKAINTAAYNLMIANANEKNKMFFRTPFLFGNTNMMDFKLLQSIHDFTAVERRFHVTIDVEIDPKYIANGRLNVSELPTILVEDIDNLAPEWHTYIPNDFWLLKVSRWSGNCKSAGRHMLIKDVIKLIIDKHHDNIKDFYVNRKTTRECVADLVSDLGEFYSGDALNNAAHKINFHPQSLPTEQFEDSSEETNSSIGSRHDDRFIFINQFLMGNPTTLLSMFIHYGVDMSYIRGRSYDRLRTSHLSYVCRELRSLSLFISGQTDVQVAEWVNLFFLDNEEFTDKLIDDFYDSIHTTRNSIMEVIMPVHIYVRRLIDKVTSTVYNGLVESIKFIKDNFLTILFVGVPLIGGLYYIVKGVIYLTDCSMFEPQSIDNSRAVAKGSRKNPGKLAARPMHPNNYGPQALASDGFSTESLPAVMPELFGIKSGHGDIMAKILNKYQFLLFLHRVDSNGTPSSERVGHIVNVRGQIFWMDFHFVHTLEDKLNRSPKDGTKYEIIMTSINRKIVYRFLAEDFIRCFEATYESLTNDYCIVKLPITQLHSRGILPYMITNSDRSILRKCTRFRSAIVGTYMRDPKSNVLSIRQTVTDAKFSYEKHPIKASWPSDEPYYSFDENLEYKMNCTNGDCGSLVFLTDTKFANRCVVGMHVAGTDTLGLANCVTKEDMETMLKYFDHDSVAFEEEEMDPNVVEKLDFEPQSGLTPSGDFIIGSYPATISKSDLTKSKLYGKLPSPYDVVTDAPSRLGIFIGKDEEVIDPGLKALENYAKLPGCYPLSFVDGARESYLRVIESATYNYNYRRIKIGLREALSSFRNIKSIATSTSPGYPFNLSGVANLKKLYYNAWNDGDLDKSEKYYLEIECLVEEAIMKYRKKLRPLFYYTDNLKDERRPLEKFFKGLTRMFSGCPFILLLLFRMYFGAFQDAFFIANIEVGSAITLNPFSEDWDMIARKLAVHGRRGRDIMVGAGDYSKFDGHENPALLNQILLIINTWYGDVDVEDNKIRSFLWAEITNSKHVFRSHLYLWFTSMPSGNPLTAMINTMYNNLQLRVAWQIADLPIESFNNNCYMIALGDDILFSVSAGYQTDFNELTLPFIMAKSGMVYTTETKGDASCQFRKLTEVEFLKRSFVYNNRYSRWIAPLRKETIFGMLNWTKKGYNKDQILVDNIGNALREISLHGREEYVYWYPKLKSLWFENIPELTSNTPVFSTYENALANALDTYFEF